VITLGLSDWRPFARLPPCGVPVERYPGVRRPGPARDRVLVEVHWSWGRTYRFQEVHRSSFRVDGADPSEIDAKVDAKVSYAIDSIVRDCAFDCGRRGYPLHPVIGRVQVIPTAEGWSMPDGRYDELLAAAVERRRTECRE